MLQDEEVLLDLYMLTRFHVLPRQPLNDLWPAQKRLILEAETWMGDWTSIKERVSNILRLKMLKSVKNPLVILAQGEAAALRAVEKDPMIEAKAKLAAEIKKLDKALRRGRY